MTLIDGTALVIDSLETLSVPYMPRHSAAGRSQNGNSN